MSIRMYRSLDEVPGDFGPSALTIGNFDGAHIGHREIFRRVSEVARREGWVPSALTFDPHPARVVAPNRAPRLLSTPEERCHWMAAEGIERAVILPFTPEFSCLTPGEFVRQVLVDRLQVRELFVGWNFRFGRNQSGATKTLVELGERFGFGVQVQQGIHYRGRSVSSSEIRKLLSAGHVALVNRMLGRVYSVAGAVVPGQGIGSKKTVPTLNLRTDAEVLPARGVYITRTEDSDTGASWPSVTNVGYRPTFKGENLTVESHVLEPLNGADPAHIRVGFLERLRAEKSFPDAESLKRQILKDVARANAYFRRVNRWVGKAAG